MSHDKLQPAKAAVVLDQYFFGALLCNLQFREDTTCDTAWTDGTTLGYNPEYINGLEHAEIVGLLAHEVLHCAGGHPYRRDLREPKRWNMACDMAINPIVKEAGMVLPDGALECPKEFLGQSAEWIYDRLPETNDNGQPDAPGEVRDSPSPSQGDGEGKDDNDGEGNGEAPSHEVRSEGEWKEITRQAATVAKSMGSLPASLDRFAKVSAQSRIDWKSALRKFVEMNSKSDYSWTRPSARYISQDIYLPSLRSEDCGHIAIGVDTSGSMDEIALSKAKAEILAVIDEVKPSRVSVLYADSRVAKVDVFERDDEVTFKPAGGGGTDFRPVFKAVDAMEEPPVCIIYITDLCGSFPDGSSLPTLWVTDTPHIAPFGDTLRME